MSERKPKTDLRCVPTNALLKELERRGSNEYQRRVGRELRARRAAAKEKE
jgi:hypothetical protein